MFRWSFAASPPVLCFGVAVWLASLVLSYAQWRRRGGGTVVLALESLRILIVTLLCLALLKPEAVRDIQRNGQPRVVILSDASGSMKTRDVALDDKSVTTRADWLASAQSTGFWKPLAARASVAVESFAQPPVRSLVDPPPTAPPRGVLKKAPTSTPHWSKSSIERKISEPSSSFPMAIGILGIRRSPPPVKFRAKNIPLYTVGVGSEAYLPDLVLEHARHACLRFARRGNLDPIQDSQSSLSRGQDDTYALFLFHGCR